jgi:hypothetical protein
MKSFRLQCCLNPAPSPGHSLCGLSIQKENFMFHFPQQRTVRNLIAGTGLLCFAAPSFAHVNVVAPNGGEVFNAGDQVSIEWVIAVAHSTQNWDVWYSSTGALGPWIPIAMDLPAGNTAQGAVHTYMWTAPSVSSTEMLVRVRQDNSANDYEDISDGDFTIQLTCCGIAYCDPSNLNSSGLPAQLEASGSHLVTDSNFILRALQLPPNQFGYPLFSNAQATVPVASGILCLGGQIGRFTSNLFNSGGAGDSGPLTIDLNNLPSPIGGAVLPGETWNFQVWYRDVGTSNFTSAVTVVFQ